MDYKDKGSSNYFSIPATGWYRSRKESLSIDGQYNQIDDLVFEYREKQLEPVSAVNHVILEIEKGSFTAIIGKNGSGKSTLAKNINALLLPSSGAVYERALIQRMKQSFGKSADSGMVFRIPITTCILHCRGRCGVWPENLGVEPGKSENG